MHGLPIPKDGGATVLRCYGATVPFHFLHLTLHLHLSPPGWSGFQGLLGNRLWLPSSLTSGAIPHQVNLPPSHIVHVFRVTFLLRPPALLKEKKTVKTCVVFFLKKAKKKKKRVVGEKRRHAIAASHH